MLRERNSDERSIADVNIAGLAGCSNASCGLVRVLSVSPRLNDHVQLREFLSSGQWKVHEAHTYTEAVRMLCYDQMAVVICDAALPGGNWIDILSQTAPVIDAPRLIVAWNRADAPGDRLRAHVLDLGGFDVLFKPLDKGEVVRVVTGAWRNWQKEWSSHAKWVLPRSA